MDHRNSEPGHTHAHIHVRTPTPWICSEKDEYSALELMYTEATTEGVKLRRERDRLDQLYTSAQVRQAADCAPVFILEILVLFVAMLAMNRG